MTDEYALPPQEALKVIADAGSIDPAKLIRDHAEAGLVRTYALVMVTIDQRGERSTVRGARVPVELWERINRDGVAADVWTGGTVRLPRSDLIGGESAVHLTGVAFHARDLERLASQQQSAAPASIRRRAVPMPRVMADVAHEPAPKPIVQGKAPDLSRLHAGALLLTQAEAMAATGTRRTKFHQLLNTGELERCPNNPRMIMADSVRRYAGLSS